MDETAVVSVLIVTWNNEATIGPCLAAAADASVLPTQILVWDNASTDATVERVEAVLPPGSLIRSRANIGFARAVNRLARMASGNHFVLLNPDAFVERLSIDALVETSESAGGAIVGGRLEKEGCVQRACARPFVPSWRTAAWLLTGREPVWRVPDQLTRVDAVSGAFMLVPRPLWEALRGLDEGYPHSSEDLDLCWRAACDGGADVVFDPGATAAHDLGASVRQASPEIDVLRWIGALRFVRRREGPGAAALLRAALGLQLLISAGLSKVLISRSERNVDRNRALRRWLFRGSVPALPFRPETT